MLVPAATCSSELKKAFAEFLYSDELIWFRGRYSSINPIDPDEGDGIFSYAIIDYDENDKKYLSGYLEYREWYTARQVTGFRLISFCPEPSMAIGIDLYKLFKKLLKNHDRIEWSCIEGCPQEAHYDKFLERLKRLGWNTQKINFHKCTLGKDLQLVDQYTYEAWR